MGLSELRLHPRIMAVKDLAAFLLPRLTIQCPPGGRGGGGEPSMRRLGNASHFAYRNPGVSETLA